MASLIRHHGGKTSASRGVQLCLESLDSRLSKRLLAAMVSLGLATGGVAAQEPMKGAVRPFASVPLAQDADVACLQSALETGNPRSDPATWILTAPPSCVVPWHSHTAQEQLMVVAGQVMAEMTITHRPCWGLAGSP